MLLQVDPAMADKSQPWLPYEKSYTENSILFPCIPRHFYQFRWWLMNHSPLCRRVPGGRFTWGELCVTGIIVAQMAWMLLHWAIDPDMRRDTSSTGALFSRASSHCNTCCAACAGATSRNCTL